MNSIKIKRNIRRYKLINSDLLNKFVADITDRRDKALAMLLIDTGLRLGEVIQLDVDSITYVNRELSDGSVRTAGTGQLMISKSGAPRTFSLSARTLAAITEYLAVDRADDGLPALFVSKSGTRLSTHTIVRAMHGWCDLLGVERFPLHDFRRRFAAGLIDGGCELLTLQALLGHSSVETTMRLYPRLDLKVD